jgi:hypothetical protein
LFLTNLSVPAQLKSCACECAPRIRCYRNLLD